MHMRISKTMRTFIPILKENGYYYVRCRGSHFTFSNGQDSITVNRDLNKMVKRRLIKEHNLVEKNE